jgi:hypothetical protein
VLVLEVVVELLDHSLVEVEEPRARRARRSAL